MKERRIICWVLTMVFLLSSISAFAMETQQFDKGMAKGIEYFNSGLYYEAKDEFQWFCDYNWGAMNEGQQKYALDYLDGTKSKIQEWEHSLLSKPVSSSMPAYVNNARIELGVPNNEGITFFASDSYYWYAGERYCSYVEFYENGECVAGAEVDPNTGELIRGILLY